MAKENIARKTLFPTDKKIVVRVAFLYVGQGASAIVFVRDTDVYRVILVDINLDRKAGGIDVVKLMTDLLTKEDGSHRALNAFANTHPHDDHLCGLEELSKAIEIKAVWHPNHKPSKVHGDKVKELTALIKKVKEKEGNAAEVIIESNAEAVDYGNAQFHFLHPTEHLTDDVNEEEAEKRYARIHEQCGVIKFGKGTTWICIAGDADRCAFKEHIMKGHPKARLESFVLGASHHGSTTFFRNNDDEDDYVDALTAIDPSYVVVSAPKQEESKHEHPDDEAMDLYKKQVGDEFVFHLGHERKSYFFDIFDDGTTKAYHDDGKLAEHYGLEDDDDGDGGGKENRKSQASTGPFIPPRGQSGDYAPRKYG